MAEKLQRLLVLVDYQNDFVDGSLGFPKAVAMEDKIAEKIKEYANGGDEIVLTMDTHQADYLETQEGKNLPVAHCVKGTSGWEVYGKIKDLTSGYRQFEKVTFGSAALFDYLRQKPFSQIELAGLVSNICLMANVVLAKTAQPETPVLVDANCTATFDQALNEKTLDVMTGLQVKIINRA